MIRLPGRRALVVACLVLLIAPFGHAQFAGVTPQFPYGPVQPAPLGPIRQGSVATWLGADNGSMAIFPDRKATFWVFGDTFIGPAGATDRSFPHPKVVNTIALGWPDPKAPAGTNPFPLAYYYRGNFGWNATTVTNNPSPFFVDPDAYSDDPNITPHFPPDPGTPFRPNRNAANPTGAITAAPLSPAQVSRFWTGKALFHHHKLYVFMSRFDFDGKPLGSSVARVGNAVTAAGGPTDPRGWQVDFIKLSTVNPADPKFAPLIGCEAFVLNDQDMIAYGNIASKPGGLAFLVRIPLDALEGATNGSDISGLIQYRAAGPGTGGWATSTAPGLPFGRGDRTYDPNIPGGGGFTVRFVSSTGLWRNVCVDFANDPGYVSVQYGPSPFGPFAGRQRVFKFPELDKGNTPFDLNRFSNGYSTGIYSPWLDKESTSKCYMAFETPAFSADPDNLIAFTYCVDDAGTKPPYPAGCRCAPGEPMHWLWDNNFYRVKGVPGQVPFPIGAP